MRQSKHKRNPERYKSVQLRERDFDIILMLIRERIMTTSQIASLFFGHKSRATARLHQLWNAGYLERELLPPASGDIRSRVAVFSPNSKGVSAVTKAFNISRKDLGWKAKSIKITHWTKQHEIEVNQVKIAMILAIAQRFDFWTSTKGVKAGLKQHQKPNLFKIGEKMSFEKGIDYYDKVQDPDSRVRHIPIAPDRFMCLSFDDQEVYGFWEIDRGTMNEKRFAKKLQAYREYYFSGEFMRKYSDGQGKKEDYPFRVFTTTPNERRRNRLVQVAGHVGSNTMCWFATLDDYLAEPFGKVWVRAKEYKELMQTLPSDIQTELQKKQGGRPSKRARQAQEDIENQLIKHSILGF
jgi:hypothetical protein